MRNVNPCCLRALALVSLAAWSAAFARAGDGAPILVRGPYLQSATPNEITLVCTTDAPCQVTLRYGLHAGPPWEFERTSALGTTHAFELSELRPESRYAYELASGDGLLVSEHEQVFCTTPQDNSRAPFRFVAWGDSGTGNTRQFDVARGMEFVLPRPDLALGLGDLVYEAGEQENYDPRFFRPYTEILRRMTFWPALGNHDVDTQAGAPYLENFYLPTASGAPGHPSDTERYYSFDQGMAHFTCLDSASSSTAPGSPMYAWLEDDLDSARARDKRWLIVFMHHPPYSHGEHNSDTDPELIALHDHLVPVFDAKGVDLVMTGHSHVYERSYLVQHDAVLQSDPEDYSKLRSSDGTIYVVSGCGGQTDNTGSLDHPLMARSIGGVNGFSLIDVSWEELRGSFVERDGTTADVFRLHKSLDAALPRLREVRPRSVAELDAIFDESVQPGLGPNGAEDPDNYSLQPAGEVLAATLDSDRLTVHLTTTPLELDRGYTLTVRQVDSTSQEKALSLAFCVSTNTNVTPTSVVPRGATWRYWKGSIFPGDDWMQPAFDDSAWSEGQAGFGIGNGDDATELDDMRDNYVSVYLRTSFEIADPRSVVDVNLAISYDDGFVGYLNGKEIARVNVPLGQTNESVTSASHSAGGAFETFDALPDQGVIVAGTNWLAVEGHNERISSDDFSLHPELVLALAEAAPGPPRAVIDAAANCVNVPAVIGFSSALSEGDEGAPAAARWDFGDGSPIVTGTAVEHLFERAGPFTATLTVTDDDGLESTAQAELRLLGAGSGPTAAFVPSAPGADTQTPVTFDSTSSFDPDGGELYREWSFGDPASGAENRSTDVAPSHVFAAAGTYTVELRVIDDEGSTATTSTELDVQAALTAQFTASAASADPLELTFTDASTGGATGWSWSFGDGEDSAEQNPVHRYAAAGDYSVSLTVSDSTRSDTVVGVVHVAAANPSHGGGGGGCSVAPTGGPRGGDPSFALCLALVLLALWVQRRREAARAA